jgi:hypothetical protein
VLVDTTLMNSTNRNPNRRALVALRNVAVILTVVIVGGWSLLAGPALYDCHRRGFEIIWNPLPSGCFVDASEGLPKHRW